MIIFTDLDGTLIRSASRKRAGDIVVEYKDGREITCIFSESAEILSRLDGIVPVTSRSIEQYKRIVIPGFSPKYAVVDNGGNLLVDGVPDKEWAVWADEAVKLHGAELEKCADLLEKDADRSFEVRFVDGRFLFTKSRCPERTLKALAAADTTLDLYNTGEKIYAVPPEFDKGKAVRRLLDILGRSDEKVVCAGDSVMDIPMLEIADIAVFPDDMGLGLNGFSCPRGELCEFTVQTVNGLCKVE